MIELLERWAKAEPERCSSRDFTFSVTCDGREISCHRPDVENGDPIDQAIILAAVIEAIEARGWWWKLQRHGPRPRLVEGFVGPGGKDVTPRVDEAHTPAAALLSAYLIALEAQS